MKNFIKLVLLAGIVVFALYDYRFLSFSKGFSKTEIENGDNIIEFCKTIIDVKKVEYYKNIFPNDSKYYLFIETSDSVYLLPAEDGDISALEVAGFFLNGLKPQKITPIPIYVEIVLGVVILCSFIMGKGRESDDTERKSNKKSVIAAVLIVVLLVGFAGLYSANQNYLNSSNGNNSNQNNDINNKITESDKTIYFNSLCLSANTDRTYQVSDVHVYYEVENSGSNTIIYEGHPTTENDQSISFYSKNVITLPIYNYEIKLPQSTNFTIKIYITTFNTYTGTLFIRANQTYSGDGIVTSHTTIFDNIKTVTSETFNLRFTLSANKKS